MNKSVILILFLLLTASCGKINRVDNAEMHALMEDRKVKYISQNQFLERVTEIGEGIRSKLNKDTLITCKDTMQMGGDLVELYQTESLTSSQLNDGIKGELLGAYQHAFQQGQHVGVTVQNLSDTLYVYGFSLSKKSNYFIQCQKNLAFVVVKKSRVVRSFKAIEGFHLAK